MSIYTDWMQAKEAERAAVELRRELEDKMTAAFGIVETDEGTRTFLDQGYKVKITCRHNKKVDVELLQEIAAEHGLTDELPRLFRWSADVDKKAWDAAGDVVAPLAVAITAKPGRPSYTIEMEDESNG